MNEQLSHALNSRIVIEQAKGMVAERANLNMEQAFSTSHDHARRHNLRLADVAHGVIDGTLDPSTLDRRQLPYRGDCAVNRPRPSRGRG